MVLMINGLFYATDSDDESPARSLYIGVISAIVVGAAAALVVKFAKKIGYLEWELHLLALRYGCFI